MNYERNIWNRHKTNLILGLIIAALALALTCNAVFSQTKWDNTIFISKVTPSKIVSVLFDNGYIIDKNDSTFISTEVKTLKGSSLKIAFNIKDLVVVIKGWSQLTFMHETTLIPVSFAGMKNSPEKKAWNEMDNIAKLISDSVSYAKK